MESAIFFPHQAWEMTKGENEGKTLKNNLYKNFRKSWGKKMIFQKGGGGKYGNFGKYIPLNMIICFSSFFFSIFKCIDKWVEITIWRKG